ncbi:MAG: hypothetical protein QXW98_07830 [Candidatus Caldarchaeum sp.]
MKRLFATAINLISYPALLGLLLVLSTLCAFGTSVNATPDEIKFIGTALRQEANIGVLSWVVRIDQLLSGPAFCPSPIEVIVGGGVLPVGYVDPDVTVGDRVEVYGEVEIMFWSGTDGGGVVCTVFLPQRYHYFRKTAGPDPCQLDSDRDGVPDCRDSCSNTPPGTRVDEFGCPIQPSRYNVLVQVSDAATGGRLSGATVALDGNWAATTNSNGEATITVSLGTHEVAAWKEGYDWATIQSYIDHDTTIRILLRRHPDNICRDSSFVRGTVMTPPVVDQPPDYGHFFLKIAEIIHDYAGAVSIGDLIQVRVTTDASRTFSEIRQGDYVEVCANWDTELYCNYYGCVRKALLPETDLAISENDISFSNPNPTKGETITIKATVHNNVEEGKRTCGTISLNPRIIKFSDYEWIVKDSKQKKIGPGDNYWSDSDENVCVDEQGRLHLKITEQNGKWYSAEVFMKDFLGYGEYIFYLDKRPEEVAEIYKDLVLGLFTYSEREDDNNDDIEVDKGEGEIDIEFTRAWMSTNAQYAVKPDEPPGPWRKNPHEFNIHSPEKSTHKFIYNSKSEKRVVFQSIKGHNPEPQKSDIIEEWAYEGDNAPEPTTLIPHINFWLFQGIPPSDPATQNAVKQYEIIIKGFEFRPHKPKSKPESRISWFKNPWFQGCKLDIAELGRELVAAPSGCHWGVIHGREAYRILLISPG